MLNRFTKAFNHWLEGRHPVSQTAQRLVRNRVYILPTKVGYAFALMLFVMFLGAINYNNNMTFFLTFLLGMMAANTMWYTYRNLANLVIYPPSSESVFAGSPAPFHFVIKNENKNFRYVIILYWSELIDSKLYSALSYTDVPSEDQISIVLNIPETKRGKLTLNHVQIKTRFPLGLFQAWSWVNFPTYCWVYPKPKDDVPLQFSGREAEDSQDKILKEVGQGGEDFSHLRNYRPGDSPKQIAWKAFARNEVLLSKQYADYATEDVWLDWFNLHQDTETRLSILCAWVLQAEQQQWHYGLKLPNLEIPPNHGTAHYEYCLMALACFPDLPSVQL